MPTWQQVNRQEGDYLLIWSKQGCCRAHCDVYLGGRIVLRHEEPLRGSLETMHSIARERVVAAADAAVGRTSG